ncbi:MAG: hypothetical protein OK439_05995, partial [Thaumarchaeota archaeon]|nr:hypothetical protein [Nitrososphaerota archaeon]
GQHYLIDLVGGGIYAAISVVVVEKYLTRKKSNVVTIDVPLQVESQNEEYSSREGKSSSAS